MAPVQSKADKDLVGRVMRGYDQDRKPHDRFVQDVDRRYRAYRGVIERGGQADSWRNKQRPPYIYQVIEMMVSSMLDPNPRWRLRAWPRLDKADSLHNYQDGADANQILLDYQLAEDHFIEKQRPFGLQGLICGLTAGKTSWLYTEGPRNRLQPTTELILHPEHGYPIGQRPVMRPVVQDEVFHDDPTFEVVDIRDFIWHEAAVSLEKALRVHHRVWMTFEELKAAEKTADNPDGLYQNVDALKETSSQGQTVSSREQDLFQVSRTKDMIEVVEHWWRQEDGTIRVTTTGNRSVLLRDMPNPFWHGGYPFVVASGSPDLFRIPGISVVEMIQEIQEIIWSLLNQTMDNLELLNNAIIIRDESTEGETFDFYPGAQNYINPQMVQVWQPNVQVTQMTMPHLSALKDDLQSIPGATPTMLGQIDPSSQTATEISTVASMGQRRIAAAKHQFSIALGRVGEQWIDLNQQFIGEDRVVAIEGAKGEVEFKTIRADLLQGRYRLKVEQLDESMIRQQRQAEAQARMQIAGQLAPLFAATPNLPQLNLQAFMDDILDASDIGDHSRYYLERQRAPQQLGPAGGQAPPGMQGPPQPGQGPAGITAPEATDAASPSNPVSQSPMMAMQRMLAMNGGPANA